MLVIVPAVAFQVTLVFVVPVTEAMNCWLAPVGKPVLAGERVIPTTAVGCVTLTSADADLVVSATLVAVTV